MNAKMFAHQTQARLETATGLRFKRTHIYELLAAALGENSYAALVTRGLLCPLPSEPLRKRYAQVDAANAESRATALGYPSDQTAPLAEIVCSELQTHHLGVVPLEDILNRLLFGFAELSVDEDGADDEDDDAWDDDEDVRARYDHKLNECLELKSPWVVEGLRTAAERGDGRAHLAMALLVDGDLYEDEEDAWDGVPDSRSGLYWYERQQKGEALTGVEKEWANGYADRKQQREDADAARVWRQASAKEHLQNAAALGQHDALLFLADRYGDDRFFDLKNPIVQAAPMWIADIADRVGRYEWVPAWTTLAAEQGHIGAMRELIQNAHRNDSLKSWTWFYLAQLHGIDLTRDNYHAIHEDGSSYDDDLGGAMFADGEDGVKLPGADEKTKAQASALAQTLFTNGSEIESVTMTTGKG
ncbi:hypothetical protein [Polaromonas sp. SM01]|uniref:hypothetical protein n=1 Tax=Polaromonas sp. SM01 TaxID=3085630 RepID=UPI0029823974|nr:hypothetical protein [Polaromonas sp. SM01]MDW5444851.1 hypothetical protein [Polaromonas sp. SM01]